MLIRLASVRRLFNVAWCARLAVIFTFFTCASGAGAVCVCVCVCVCVRACARARVYVRACARVCAGS